MLLIGQAPLPQVTLAQMVWKNPEVLRATPPLAPAQSPREGLQVPRPPLPQQPEKPGYPFLAQNTLWSHAESDLCWAGQDGAGGYLDEVVGEPNQACGRGRLLQDAAAAVSCKGLLDAQQQLRHSGDPLLLGRSLAGIHHLLHCLVQSHIGALKTLPVVLEAEQGILRWAVAGRKEHWSEHKE